jgi:hypothetical protein
MMGQAVLAKPLPHDDPLSSCLQQQQQAAAAAAAPCLIRLVMLPSAALWSFAMYLRHCRFPVHVSTPPTDTPTVTSQTPSPTPPGEGKPRMLDEKETTVYKRALDMAYNLKLKASRQVLNEINKRAPTMPFSVRCLEEVEELRGGARNLGLVECLNHGLLHAYPVLHEKQGELVAQVRGRQLGRIWTLLGRGHGGGWQ